MSAMLFNKSGVGNRVQYVSSADADAAGYPTLYPGFYSSLPTPPKRLTSPTIKGENGETVVGTLFEVTDGTVEAWPAATSEYQWNVNGTPAPGEVGLVFDSAGLSASDQITCTQTVTNAYGSVDMVSNIAVLS